MSVKTYQKTDRSNLTKNFTVSELSCHGSGCCSTVKIDSILVDYLQKIRDHFGKPVTINSGYRCAKHNKAVGGASGSRHTKGQAADIVVKDVAPAEVAKYAESIGILGIGLYETAKDGYFVHIDTRTEKAFWYGQAQDYRSTFGGVNAVKEWQDAAIADGYKFPRYGADGSWGAECVSVARKALVMKQRTYTNENLTKIVQRVVGVSVDGKCGSETDAAIVKYQEKNGLAADGVVGLNTWKKILGV